MITSSAVSHGLVRVPMTWERYRAESPTPSEYYDGAMVVMNSPTRRHQQIVQRLERVLEVSLPAGTAMTAGWGWSPADVEEELIPDVMVHSETTDDATFTGIPLLVVEVLSSNRRDDLVARFNRYAAWGARDYWIVDPRDKVLLTFRSESGIFSESGRHTDGRVNLSYADIRVELDLDDLWA